MKNYKKDGLGKLSKKEIIKQTPITPDMVEKYEVELAGGAHLPAINGPDGVLPDGTFLEIKSQRYMNNYQLEGRGKFGSPTYEIFDAKSESDELIIVVGYHAVTGEVYYRFDFRFDAIAVEYQHSASTKQSTYNSIPMHYKDHKSFNVQYVANGKILERDSDVFKPGFYKFLQSYNQR